MSVIEEMERKSFKKINGSRKGLVILMLVIEGYNSRRLLVVFIYYIFLYICFSVLSFIFRNFFVFYRFVKDF